MLWKHFFFILIFNYREAIGHVSIDSIKLTVEIEN